jgi:hypothetical protein
MRNIQALWVATTLFILAGCSSTGIKFLDEMAAQCCATEQSARSSSDAMKQAAEAAESSAASSRNTSVPGQIKINDGAGDVVIQTVDFRPGMSSTTVERLAKRFGCTGTVGAGLVTDKGPVEVYRMKCDNGTTFMAQCELRQCRPMR